MTWKKVKFGEELKVKSGVNLTQEKMDVNGAYSVYGGNGVTGKHSSFNVNEPTIIIGRVGYYCGSVHLTNGKAWVTDNAFITKFSPNTFNLKFLYYVLRQLNLRQYSNSSAQPVISGGGISGVEIVCPPLYIQQQIADTLDKADALRQKDQQLLQKYDELAQSIFYDMFGDPISDYKGWKVRTLKDVCLKITDGTHLSPKFVSSGIPFLFVSNIKDDQINYNTDRYIGEEEYQTLFKRTPIQVGDILLTTVGSYGNPAVVENSTKFMFQRHIAYLKLNPTYIVPYFLFRQLKSSFVQNQIDRKVRGIAQKTLNLNELNEIEIFLPPIELQRSFDKMELLFRKIKSKMLEGTSRDTLLVKALVTNYFS